MSTRRLRRRSKRLTRRTPTAEPRHAERGPIFADGASSRFCPLCYTRTTSDEGPAPWSRGCHGTCPVPIGHLATSNGVPFRDRARRSRASGGCRGGTCRVPIGHLAASNGVPFWGRAAPPRPGHRRMPLTPPADPSPQERCAKCAPVAGAAGASSAPHPSAPGPGRTPYSCPWFAHPRGSLLIPSRAPLVHRTPHRDPLQCALGHYLVRQSPGIAPECTQWACACPLAPRPPRHAHLGTFAHDTPSPKCIASQGSRESL